MKRRVFSLILCLCMMFSMISEAVAAGIPSNSTSGISVLAQSELVGLNIVVPEGEISLGETIELSTMAIYSDGGSAAVAADYSVIPSSAGSVKGNKLTANAEDDVRILATYDGLTVMKDITIGEKSETGVALRAEKDIDARTLTVYVEADENPGVASFNMELGYDNTYLVPVKVESTGYTGQLMSNIDDPENSNTEVVVTQGYSDKNYTGKNLYAVTFDILEAAYGETQFDLSVEDASNEVYEDVDFTSVSGTTADLTEVVLALDASFVDADTVEVVVSATKNEGFASFNLELTANDGFLPFNVIAGEYSGEIISNIDEVGAGDTLVVQGYGASDYEETAVLFTVVYDVVSPNGGNNEFRAVVGDAGFNTEKYETVIPDVTNAVDYLTFGSATLDVTAEKVTVGNENYIDVTASALNHYGIATFIASLSVDNEDAVSLVSSAVSKAASYAYNGTLVSNQDENPDSNVNPLYVTGYAASNQFGSTVIPDAQLNLFSVRYKLLKNEDVTFTLSYVDGDFCDEDLNSVTLLDNPTSVTVYADATVTLTALALSASKTVFFTDDVTGIDFTATATYSDGTSAVVNVDDDSYTVTPTSSYDVVGDSLTKLQDSGNPGEAQTVTVTAVYEGVVSNTVSLTAVNPLQDMDVTYVGEDMTLADVALPEGWKWQNASTPVEEGADMEAVAVYGDLMQTVKISVSANVDFRLAASYYEEGEDRLIHVTLLAENNQGFASYQTKIFYDNAIVAPVQDSYHADFYNGSIQQPEYDASGSISLIGYNDSDYVGEGNVYSLTFRVNDSVVNYEDITTYFSLAVDAVCNEQLETIVPDVEPRTSVVIPALPEVRNDKWTLSASEVVDGKFTVYVNTPVNDGFASFTTALTYTSDNEDLVVKPVSVTAVDYPGMITTSEVQNGYINANPVKLQGANASDYFGNGQLLAVDFEVVEEATGTVTFTLDINEGDMICTEDYKEVVPTFEGTTVSVVKEDRVDEWVLSASEITDGKFTVYVSTPANEGFASFTTELNYASDNADLVVKHVSVKPVDYPGMMYGSSDNGKIVMHGTNASNYFGTGQLVAIEFEVVKEATGTVSFTMDIAEDGDICTEDYKDVFPKFTGTSVSFVKEERADKWTLSASEIADNKFTVYVNTPVNEGFASFTTALTYATDNEDLVVKPVSVASVNYPGIVTASEAVGGYIHANPMIIQGANTTDYFGTDALIAITFEIVEIADGTVTFTMDIAEDGNICTEDYEDVVPTFEGTSVTVVAPEEPEAPILNMDAVYVSTEEDGRFVDVTLSVERNSGFASFDVDVAYDANVLVPTTITKGDYIGTIGKVEFAELNGIVPIVGYNDADYTADGELVTIRFNVKDSVLTETVVSFSASFGDGDFCDEDKKTVTPENNTPCEATIAGAGLELIANPAAIAKNETTVFITNVLAYSTVDGKAYVLKANVTPDSMSETAGILAIATDMKSAEGIAVGDTPVTATYQGMTADAIVNVYASVTSIDVTVAPTLILSTDTATLTTVANGADVVNNAVVEYTAVPAGIVSIENGVVTVIGEVDGKALVTITGSYAGLTDDAVLTIVSAPEEQSIAYFEGVTLSDVALPEGWAWVDSSIALPKASDNSYKAVYTENGATVEAEVVVHVSENVTFNMDATYVSTEATGRYIDVVLSAENNQGFATFDVDATYDATALVPVSITKGDYTGTVTDLDPNTNYNGSIAVVGYSDTDYEEDGVLATIRFKVLDDVLYETTVSFAADYTLGDVCNDAKKTIMPENNTACEATIAAATLALIADPDTINVGETTAFTVNVLATSTEDGSTYVLIADVTADTISDSEGILGYYADDQKSAIGELGGITTVTATYKSLSATDVVNVIEIFNPFEGVFNMEATYASTESTGRYVDVVLSVENNQGFASFDVDVAYDKNVLTPVTITKGDYTGSIAPIEFAEANGTVALVGYSDSNYTEDGVLATIRFKVSNAVLSETVVNFSATYADGDVCDEDKATVSPENKTACEATIAAAALELIANPDTIDEGQTTAFTVNVLATSTVDGSTYALISDVTADTISDSEGILNFAADKKSAVGETAGVTTVTASYKNLTATDIVTVNEVIVPSNIAFVMDATYGSTEADGRYVDVVLSVEDNNGFASFDVDVAYDKNVLTPVTITKGDYTGSIAPVEFAEANGTIALVGYNDANYTEDGVLATIRFKVSDAVLSETVVNFSATYADGDVCDEDKATVSPENKTACEATIAAAVLELIANPAAIAKDATTALTTNVLVYSTVDNSTYVLIADVTADTMTESAGILTIADDKKSATGNVVGDTTVTATYKGLTATADVNVYGTVTSIEVSVDPILILDTDTANLTTVANGSDVVNNAVVEYTAVPAGIVSIENGVVTVIGEIDGKAVVTITGSYAGLTDDAVLTIVAAPEEQSIAYFEGVTLSDVALPEGWTWVDETTALSKNSADSYKAIYTENGASVTADVVVRVSDNVQFNMNATYVSTQATGRYIDVVLSAANNQGFASFDVDVTYDTTALKPVSITKGDYTGTIADVDFATLNGIVPVVGYNDANFADDGVLATVRFEVLDSVLAATVVNFAATYGAGDVCNDDNKTIMPENNTACSATIDAVSAELMADPAAIQIGETTEFTMNILAVSTEDGSTYVLLSDVTADTMTDSEGILTIAVDTMSAIGNAEGTTTVTADYKGVTATATVNVYDAVHAIEVTVNPTLILTTDTANLTTVADGTDTVDNSVVTYTANSSVVTIENGVVTVTGEVADKVVVTITGSYAGLTDDATLTIVKAPNPIEVDYEDGLTLEDAPLPEGWVWADPTTPLLEGSENAYKATYTENDETVEADVTVKVNEATPEKQPSFALDAVYVLDTNTESETYGDRFVDVTLSVKDNTGIASFTLNMGYNKDVVTPVSVQKDLYTGGITLSEDMTANPLTIVGASTTDITADGALFTVRFAVADDVLVETVLDGFTVSYDAGAGSICNAVLETVEVTPNPVNANAITIPKATIDMTPDTISLKKGNTKDVKVEVTYYASTDYENAETAVVDVTDSKDLDLTMEDTKIATISDDTVTAKKAGTTELTAEYFGVLFDTTTVKVTKTTGGGGGSYKPVEPVLNKEQHGRYILGYPDSTMQPNRNITREEVAVIFYRLLTESAKQSYYSEDVSMLNDVASDSWSAVQIGTLVKLGIIVGYEDGTFRPHAAITRAEFAAIACRFDNLTNAPDAGFADVQGHWAKTYIDNAYAFGWIVGYENGTFRPQNNITRAEAVTIINRVLGRDTDEVGVLNAKDIDTLAQLKQWTDLDESHWAFYQFLEATYSHEYVRRDGGTTGIENWTNLNEALNMD